VLFSDHKMECPICFENLKTRNPQVLGDCMHMLCKECYNEFIRSKQKDVCPVCREKTKLQRSIPYQPVFQRPISNYIHRYSPVRRQRRYRPSRTKCQVMLSSGRRKGQPCNAVCDSNIGHCKRKGHDRLPSIIVLE